MWFFRSIQAKVISVIILVLAATVAASIIITVTNQRQSFLDETSRNRLSSEMHGLFGRLAKQRFVEALRSDRQSEAADFLLA